MLLMDHRIHKIIIETAIGVSDTEYARFMRNKFWLETNAAANIGDSDLTEARFGTPPKEKIIHDWIGLQLLRKSTKKRIHKLATKDQK